PPSPHPTTVTPPSTPTLIDSSYRILSTQGSFPLCCSLNLFIIYVEFRPN
ncbi:hypothetical protein Leryth_012029, partial [Lithospermum erythrorhizon]